MGTGSSSLLLKNPKHETTKSRLSVQMKPNSWKSNREWIERNKNVVFMKGTLNGPYVVPRPNNGGFLFIPGESVTSWGVLECRSILNSFFSNSTLPLINCICLNIKTLIPAHVEVSPHADGDDYTSRVLRNSNYKTTGFNQALIA